MREDLIQRRDDLVAAFNGAIKYTPMLTDHPDWTMDECLSFAREWHAVAIGSMRENIARNLPPDAPGWNDGIPYCRNVATEAMVTEACDAA